MAPKLFPVFALVALLLGTATQTGAAGFGVFTQGANPLGQAVSVVAHTDGPSTIFFNPALLGDLQGLQLELGTTAIVARREFHSVESGARVDEDVKTYFPPTLYLSYTLNPEISMGLGVFLPFGLGTNWPEDWEGRYLATRSEVITYNVNPVVCYRPWPSFSIAAGIDLLFLDATLEKKLNSAALAGAPLADANQRFTGNGRGVGFNLGLAWQFAEPFRVGVSYRSRVRVDIDGEVEHGDVVAALRPALPDTGADTTITLPAVALFGIAYRPAERWVVEGGFRWEEWSSYDELQFTFDEPILGMVEATQPKDWRDTFAVHFGGQYRVSRWLALSAGYLHGQAAVPDATFEPSVPDAESHLYTVGSDLNWQGVTLSLGYGLQRMLDRTKENGLGDPVSNAPELRANGTYRSTIHLIGISASKAF